MMLFTVVTQQHLEIFKMGAQRIGFLTAQIMPWNFQGTDLPGSVRDKSPDPRRATSW